MQIEINKQIIKILRNNRICTDYIPACLVVLSALYNKDYELLNELDDNNSDLLFLEVYKDLELKGLLYKTGEKEESNFLLTENGSILIQQILMECSTKKEESKKALNLDWIPLWLDVWKNEKGKFYRTPNERSLGASEVDVKNKFIGFLNFYKDIFQNSTEEEIINTIMKVTEEYVRKEKDTGFEYTKNAMNYISKIEGRTKDTKASLLATACEEYLSQDKEEYISSFNKSIN